VVTVDEAAYAEQDLAVDTGVLGPQAMAGEYLVGRDATDGLAGYEPGNYGVVYDLHVVVEETPPTPPPVALLLWPSGGFGHYSLSLDGAGSRLSKWCRKGRFTGYLVGCPLLRRRRRALSPPGSGRWSVAGPGRAAGPWTRR
jgi:hypothetical protein